MEEEEDLIEKLHKLSAFIIDKPISHINNFTIYIIDNCYVFQEFLERDNFTYQMQLLKASDKRINLILQNFDKAIASQCNNPNLDLSSLKPSARHEYNSRYSRDKTRTPESPNRYIMMDEEPRSIQKYWLRYFIADCKKMVWIIRDILSKPQPEKKELINILDKNLKSNISYEYFSSFYDAISNQDLIFDNSFITTHRCDITHYKDYFKDEINQNLLKMDLSKREDYLELLIHKIQTTPFYNFNKTLTEVYLSKYDVDVNNFPKDLNEELYDILNTYPNCTYLNAIKKSEITQIQQSFYAYFSKIEAVKMVEFLKSKKKTVLEPKNPNQLSKNKSKSSSSKILINKNFKTIVSDKNKQEYIYNILEHFGAINSARISVLTQRKKGVLRGVVEALMDSNILPQSGLHNLCLLIAKDINLDLPSKLDYHDTAKKIHREANQYIKDNPFH